MPRYIYPIGDTATFKHYVLQISSNEWPQQTLYCKKQMLFYYMKYKTQFIFKQITQNRKCPTKYVKTDVFKLFKP